MDRRRAENKNGDVLWIDAGDGGSPQITLRSKQSTIILDHPSNRWPFRP